MMLAQIAWSVVSFSMAAPEKPLNIEDFMPRYPKPDKQRIPRKSKKQKELEKRVGLLNLRALMAAHGVNPNQ